MLCDECREVILKRAVAERDALKAESEQLRGKVESLRSKLEGLDQHMRLAVGGAFEARAKSRKIRKALEALLLLVKHETDLPDSAANGVTDPGGSLDEGIVRASEIMEQARLALKEE
ncbi:hypothetical protein LCGC14_0860630 [marine sediment metagenome]|uniref:Uncharacterized protein n=1 Tax=marine sediment metagenome TaxID=412755 RepID=A0A0F9P7G3_9ZZZZ